MKTLYFDCFNGASGDMITGALLDAGAPFDALQAALESLGVPGFHVSREKVSKQGVGATQFHVHIDSSEKPHRHLRHILEIIEGGDLAQPVREASAETFRRIAESEAEIHQSTLEKVHFHEVGAIDSIVDVISAHVCLHVLAPERIIVSPIHVGTGTVQCDHGLMPVPAPATALLMRGAPVYAGDVEAELLTPTGAALLTQIADGYGPMPEMTVEAVGYGSGQRDLPGRPNVLRVMTGRTAAESAPTQTILVVETTLDDMNPELYPALAAELFKQGAVDVFMTPVTGKKGRPAHVVTALCPPAQRDAVTQAFLQCSTTLGVRMREERRVCLERQWETVLTPWGEVRVKTGRLGGNEIKRAPEYEDCAKRAEAAGIPVLAVYQAAWAAIAGGGQADA